ncbi:DUF5518 domain-containing protein [Natrarchaeobius chitinivorans]|uniref:DUF5518 domain-containing protein n=1 Tax=Natrarchaeobius chitinivorans TaxID=1679083 RepID=A0A3N6MJQ2_NATCH|nr:DUF5518 domain-containing protein [Natrarchaeobius chitinivorans]RQG94446.1 hypothetical protein EA473_12170 [Natrarchaeobius chitinivorans]
MFFGTLVGTGISILSLVLVSYFEPLAVGVLAGPIFGGFVAGYFRGNDIRQGTLVGIVPGAIASLPATVLVAFLLFISLLWGMGSRDFTTSLVIALLPAGIVLLIGAVIGAVLGLAGGAIGARATDRPAPT